MEKPSSQIDVQLNELKRKQIEENRAKLRPIVEAVVLCGRQNLPLRGHRDDAKDQDNDDNNPGNFIEILKYGARCAGVTGSKPFPDAPLNATYRSKTTQNQLIEVCDDLIVEKIVERVQKAKFFSILADEATDCANLEQTSLVLRFVDEERHIREEFLGFIRCDLGVTGEAIANTILKFLETRSLSVDNCRGQGYDGAGNMTGKHNGAAARIQAVQSKAVYVHCNSNVLNLCVASCCKEQLVRNMMETVRVATEFFNFSPKRHACLQKIITDMFPNAKRKHLVDVCKTRWVARIDGLVVFLQDFAAVVRCFEIIKNNTDKSWNNESTQKAHSFYHSIVSLVIVYRCLELTRPLTLQLQHAALDAGCAQSLFCTSCSKSFVPVSNKGILHGMKKPRSQPRKLGLLQVDRE